MLGTAIKAASMKLRLDKLPATKFCKVIAALGPCKATKERSSIYSILTSLFLKFSSRALRIFAKSLSLQPAFTTTFLNKKIKLDN
jgi:hypothetical protein